MSGISGILGFHFWVDNDKRAPLETMLQKKDRTPKDRAVILRELAKETRSSFSLSSASTAHKRRNAGV